MKKSVFFFKRNDLGFNYAARLRILAIYPEKNQRIIKRKTNLIKK